jgi:catechol 2,3-dioxygenase-like lactoylglutathione lyase family enzyme
MYDHVGLKVKDLKASGKFYEAALGALGHVADGGGFGPKGAPALWPSEGRTAPVHVAFRAGSRAEVDRFHAAGLKAGGRDNGSPGLRKDYGPRYYAAFLLDPDGNNIEAVFNA